ncbi:MAG TPA: class A beta-lactamase-related serine hydrolase [Lacunisphaera sp.]|jgi:beta-lactamase class A|nr:serine hydrolase [Lacunisphaera sp.]HQY05350.1 class A beta-lactamase-related serine hydrolase [Lacunisphaera sp.]
MFSLSKIPPVFFSFLFGFALMAGARSVPAPPVSPLQAVVNRAVMDTVVEFRAPELRPEQLAVTVIDLRGPAPVAADFRGDERFYPASVVKLFYLAATHRRLEDGKLADTPELRRAMRDMIVDSSNDATNYLVDVLTGTTGGPELPADELKTWSEKRGAVTRYFESLGYQNVNANRKTWGDGPFGRESQDMSAHPPARNYLSTNDTARLLAEIATGRGITPARSAEMLALLARDPFTTSEDPDNQSVKFTGPALTPGMKLWSKAGWVSWARHDAALIELPGGGRVIIVTFTDGREHAQNRAIIAAVARRVLAGLPVEP